MEVGELLQGRFRVERRLGGGGMGEVWQARDEAEGGIVIVKTIRWDLGMRGVNASDGDLRRAAEARQRFAREGKALADLDVLGTPRLLARDAHEGEPYIVMEYIDGVSLHDYRRGLPLEAAIAIAVQLVRILDRAHALKIVHRDVKPMNVVLRRDGVVFLVDFGIALLSGPDATRLTETGHTPGSLGFKAPELIRGGRDTTPAADVYGFGCVLFDLLTGRWVFTPDELALLPDKHVSHPPPRVRELVPTIPADLDDLVDRLLAKRPQERPGWREIEAVLTHHLPGVGTPDPDPALVPDPTRPFRRPGMAADPAPGRPRRSASTRRSSGRDGNRPDLSDLRNLLPAADAEIRDDLPGEAADGIGALLERHRGYWGLSADAVARAQLLWADRCRLYADWAEAARLYREVNRVFAPDHPFAREARVGIAECLVPAGEETQAVDDWVGLAEELLGDRARSERLLWRLRQSGTELVELGYGDRVTPLLERLDRA